MVNAPIRCCAYDPTISQLSKMARNAEKASLMLNKWTAMKEDMARGQDKKVERRPYLASEVKSLPEAEKWRREIVRDITKRVSEIQNAGLGEARTRDLNDEINKLIREKGHWERQILSLGGPNYLINSAKAFDSDALELPGSGGYKYFGAARDLPGVKELFEAAKEKEIRRGRAEIMRGITPDYYGFREDDDAGVLRAESAAQPGATEEAAARWEQARMDAHAARMARRAAGTALPGDDEYSDEDEDMNSVQTGASAVAPGSSLAAAAPAVRQAPAGPLGAAQLQAMLAEKQRQLLLEKYGANQDL